MFVLFVEVRGCLKKKLMKLNCIINAKGALEKGL